MITYFEKENIVRKLLDVEGLFSFSNKRDIEINQNKFSPIYINIKKIWSNPELLREVSELIYNNNLDFKYTLVVGVESGGSPLATMVSQISKSSLVLLRKESKLEDFFAGLRSRRHDNILVVDDVVVTGKSSENALKKLKNIGKSIRLTSVVGYGLGEVISKKYNIDVSQVLDASDLIYSTPNTPSRKSGDGVSSCINYVSGCP